MMLIRHRLLMHSLAIGLCVAGLLTGCGTESWNKNYQLRSWERYRLAGQKFAFDRKFPQAQDQYLLAIEEARRIGESPPYHLSVSLVDLGQCYASEKHPQARQVLTDAIAVLSPAVESKTRPITNQLLLQHLAMAKICLGDVSLAEGDQVQAEQLYKGALAILKPWRVGKTGSFRDNILGQYSASTLLKLADISVKNGHQSAAKHQLEEALLISRNCAGPYKTTQKIIKAYSKVLRDTGEAQKADDFKAGKIWVQYTVESSKALDDKDYARCELLLKKALIEAQKPHQDEFNKALTLRGLAELYYKTRRFAECIAVTNEALKISDDAVSGNSFVTDSLLSRLINCYCATEDRAAAAATTQRMLALRQSTYGADSLKTGICHIYLASLYQQMGDKVQAEKQSQLAFNMFGHARPWRHKFILDIEQLSGTLMEQEKLQQAHTLVGDALDLRGGLKVNKLMFRANLLWRFYALERILNPKQDSKWILDEAKTQTSNISAVQQPAIKKLMLTLAEQLVKHDRTGDAQTLRSFAGSLAGPGK